MVFKRLLGSLGVGGPSVDTVLDPGAVAPGGTSDFSFAGASGAETVVVRPNSAAADSGLSACSGLSVRVAPASISPLSPAAIGIIGWVTSGNGARRSPVADGGSSPNLPFVLTPLPFAS